MRKIIALIFGLSVSPAYTADEVRKVQDVDLRFETHK